jgi:hypothetical protein
MSEIEFMLCVLTTRFPTLRKLRRNESTVTSASQKNSLTGDGPDTK